ncbi:hypothetical protein BDQ17DRAFT_1457743 [Cyathus striatus]|nr:hypothetical protein BDQ17DRAFT_1457743 [Cyathus striatus]
MRGRRSGWDAGMTDISSSFKLRLMGGVHSAKFNFSSPYITLLPQKVAGIILYNHILCLFMLIPLLKLTARDLISARNTQDHQATISPSILHTPSIHITPHAYANETNSRSSTAHVRTTATLPPRTTKVSLVSSKESHKFLKLVITDDVLLR